MSDTETDFDVSDWEEHDARTELKHDIQKAIAPYKRSRSKPPFTPSELAVMAVLCSNNYSLQQVDILKWVCKTFIYYNHKAIDLFAAAQRAGRSQLGDAVPGLNESWDNWNAPFSEPGGRYPATSTSFSVMTLAGPGRIFLRKWLEPERKGHFRFLDLPAEMRSTIYSMVLSFPTSGLRAYLNSRTSPCYFKALQREQDLETDLVVKHWRSVDSARVQTSQLPPNNEILALLSVNRQIYEEAMPVFHSENHFNIVLGPRRLAASFAKGLSTSRKKHITSLHIDLMMDDLISPSLDQFAMPLAIKSLQDIDNLKSFHIESCDGEWLNMRIEARKSLGRTKPFTKFEQIAFLKDLAVAAHKAETVIFHGRCAGLESWIREQMRKLSETELKLKKSKKRGRGEIAGFNNAGDTSLSVGEAQPVKKRSRVSQ